MSHNFVFDNNIHHLHYDKSSPILKPCEACPILFSDFLINVAAEIRCIYVRDVQHTAVQYLKMSRIP